MKSIIVFGQSRSGTTIIARLLDKLGVDFPEPGELKPDEVDNIWQYEHDIAKHFWTFLYEMKDPKWNVALIDLKNPQLSDYSSERCEFKRLVAKRESDLWGFKSPVFIHCWRVFVDLLQNSHFIVIHRNLNSVSRSYAKQTDKTLSESRKIAEFRNHLVFEFTAENDDPKIHINFEDLFLEPDRQIEQISEFLDLEPDYSIKEEICEDEKHF